jgi:type II secretion system protein C
VSEETGAASRRFRSLLVGIVVVTVLGFTFFLNYRDPWPPLVPRPLVPESETRAPREPPHGILNLAPLPDAEGERAGGESAPGDAPDSLPVTALPLRLLATAVQTSDPSRSFARIEDAQLSGARLMVQGQGFEARPRVTLVTIEPGSVLIENHGALERLPLDANGRRLSGSLPPAPVAEAVPERNETERARRRAPGDGLRGLAEAGGRDPLREGGALLEDAAFLPLYEEGGLVGVRMSAIRPGSLFATAGLRDGDVVRAVNGVSLDSPDAAADLLEQAGARESLSVTVERSDGSRRLVELPTQEILRRAAERP